MSRLSSTLVYNCGLRFRQSEKMETAPITQRLEDLQERVEALRGYL